jgi:gluconate kinase
MDRLVSTLGTYPTAAADFTGWLPIRLFVQDATLWVDWCYRGDAKLSAPFFQQDVQRLLNAPFNLAFRRYTPISEMVAWAEKAPQNAGHAPLKALVAHASRCGSTLVAQMLAHQSTHVVMSEPAPLDALLGIRARLPHVTREQHIRWLRALVFAFGQTPAGETHLVIKLDAWHVLQYDLLSEAFPSVPWLFIYRDPIEIAVSQFEQRASYMVPGLVSAMNALISPERAIAMGTEAYIAAVLGKTFAAGAAVCERAGAQALNYTALPDAVWHQLRPILGLNDDDATLSALRATGSRDAKSPTMHFLPDIERKQKSASASLREAVTAHCQDAYNRLLQLSQQSS